MSRGGRLLASLAKSSGGVDAIRFIWMRANALMSAHEGLDIVEREDLKGFVSIERCYGGRGAKLTFSVVPGCGVPYQRWAVRRSWIDGRDNVSVVPFR